MIRLTIKPKSGRRAQAAKILEQQAPFAISQSLNDLGFSARRAYTKTIKGVFNRPNRATVQSAVVQKASKKKLSMKMRVQDGITYTPVAAGKPPVIRWLSANIQGGRRDQKGFEKSLMRAGLISTTDIMIPSRAAKGGRIPGIRPYKAKSLSPGAYVTILSALQALGGTPRLSTKTGRQLKDRKSGSKSLKERIFWSTGTGGGRYAGLSKGVWYRSPNGAAVPILYVQRSHSYRVRLNPERIWVTNINRNMDRIFKRNWRKALRTAKLK